MVNRIVNVIEKYIDVAGIEITEQTSLNDDLGANSLDTVNIIAGIEDEFEVEIPDRVSIHFSTVGDVIEWLQENID
jgi:acyl carrier protein